MNFKINILPLQFCVLLLLIISSSGTTYNHPNEGKHFKINSSQLLMSLFIIKAYIAKNPV